MGRTQQDKHRQRRELENAEDGFSERHPRGAPQSDQRGILQDEPDPRHLREHVERREPEVVAQKGELRRDQRATATRATPVTSETAPLNP